MDLQFSTGGIRKLEREMRLPLITLVEIGTIDVIIKLLSLGMGITEEEAEKKFDEMREKVSDTQLMLLEIQDALQDQGFLSRMVDLKKVIKGMREKNLSAVAKEAEQIQDQMNLKK